MTPEDYIREYDDLAARLDALADLVGRPRPLHLVEATVVAGRPDVAHISVTLDPRLHTSVYTDGRYPTTATIKGVAEELERWAQTEMGSFTLIAVDGSSAMTT